MARLPRQPSRWPSPADVAAKPQPVPVQVEAKEFNIEQLNAMLAPIALYPEALATQILVASTYPL